MYGGAFGGSVGGVPGGGICGGNRNRIPHTGFGSAMGMHIAGGNYAGISRFAHMYEQGKNKSGPADARFVTDVLPVRKMLRQVFRNMPHRDFQQLVGYLLRNMRFMRSNFESGGGGNAADAAAAAAAVGDGGSGGAAAGEKTEGSGNGGPKHGRLKDYRTATHALVVKKASGRAYM